MTEEEVELLARLARTLESGRNEGTPSSATEVPAAEYTDPVRYEREVREVLWRRPLPLVPARELAQPGARVAHELLGVPLVVTRALDGRVHVFLNRCRHRGAAVLEAGPCSTGQRLVCPYHGWSYTLEGCVAHIPERETGFPGLDDERLSLIEVPSYEWAGLVWACLDPNAPMPSWSSQLRGEIDALDLGSTRVVGRTESTGDFNWKLGVNAFLENYHFKTTHKDSVALVFISNRILADSRGEHLRLTLPRTSLPKALANPPVREFRPHASFVYFLFPASFLSVLPDHASFVSFLPLGVDRTRVESHLFVPDMAIQGRSATETDAYWARNSALFQQTLVEDTAQCAAIQRGIRHYPGGTFALGTFEHGIAHFRTMLEEGLRG